MKRGSRVRPQEVPCSPRPGSWCVGGERGSGLRGLVCVEVLWTLPHLILAG